MSYDLDYTITIYPKDTTMKEWLNELEDGYEPDLCAEIIDGIKTAIRLCQIVPSVYAIEVDRSKHKIRVDVRPDDN